MSHDTFLNGNRKRKLIKNTIFPQFWGTLGAAGVKQLRCTSCGRCAHCFKTWGSDVFVLSFLRFHTHLLSQLYSKQFRGCGHTMSPFRVHTGRVSSPSYEIQPLQYTTIVAHPPRMERVGRVGASLPFLWLWAPSADVPVQNSQRLCPPWFHRNVRRPWIWIFRRHHAGVMQGEEGYRKQGCRLTDQFRRRVGLNLLMVGIFC